MRSEGVVHSEGGGERSVKRREIELLLKGDEFKRTKSEKKKTKGHGGQWQE